MHRVCVQEGGGGGATVGAVVHVKRNGTTKTRTRRNLAKIKNKNSR